jgi:hypothetical protein
MTVTYSGNASYPAATSGVFIQTVNPAVATLDIASTLNPSIFSEAVVLTATLTGNSGPVTGTVTFKDTGTAISTCTALPLSGGAAHCATASLVVGGHVITVTYSGDATYPATTSANYVQMVSEAVAAFDIGLTPNPSIWTEPVTLTAMLTGSAGTTPSGTVTFNDNGTAILACVALPLSGGSAQCTTATLAIGGHIITVTYSGDGIYPPATSANYTETVGEAVASLDIGLTPNPSTAGQIVTLTATITGDVATAPTGIVTFNDNGSAIPDCARLALVGGVAHCTTAWPVDGVHIITVTYSGDATYPPTTSANFVQVVDG